MPEHTERYPRRTSSAPWGQGRGLALQRPLTTGFRRVGLDKDPFGAEVCDGRIYGRGTCIRRMPGGLGLRRRGIRGGVQLQGTIEQSATRRTKRGWLRRRSGGCATRGALQVGRQRYVVITEPLGPRAGVYRASRRVRFEVTTIGRVVTAALPGLAVTPPRKWRLIRAIDVDLRPRLQPPLAGAGRAAEARQPRSISRAARCSLSAAGSPVRTRSLHRRLRPKVHSRGVLYEVRAEIVPLPRGAGQHV